MLEIFPAYGRVYGSGAEAAADWVGGKDFAQFSLNTGTYLSSRDSAALKRIGIVKVMIHFTVIPNNKFTIVSI